MESIGNRIKKLRKSLNLTQYQLGELIGKSKGNISGYENGTFDPSANTIISLAKCFNISTDDLLLGYNTQNSNVLSEFDRNLIERFNKLSRIKKERILERIDTYLEIDEEERNKLFMVQNNYSQEVDKEQFLNLSKTKTAIKHIPVLGQTPEDTDLEIIKAGGGNYVAVPQFSDIDYALFLMDDSMAPAINYRDLVYIKSMQEAKSGTTIVADIGGAIVCRKIILHGCIAELLSLNKEHDTIIINLSEGSFKIIGRVMFCRNTDLNFFAI